MSYQERPAPVALRELVECVWTSDGSAEQVRVLPDGCMDLIRMNGPVLVAGPDRTAFITARGPGPATGVRFRPGVLPRLLGVPASELVNSRVPSVKLAQANVQGYVIAAADHRTGSATTSSETAPWSMPVLAHVTRRLAGGAAVTEVAEQIGWSSRTLQRQCAAVYGYGPATLRRVLRFRGAMRLLSAGEPFSQVAARSGYADLPHLHREVRDLAGVPLASIVG